MLSFLKSSQLQKRTGVSALFQPIQVCSFRMNPIFAVFAGLADFQNTLPRYRRFKG
jgi:hypothetical protein